MAIVSAFDLSGATDWEMVLQHFLCKEKVPGSNPGVGSKTLLRLDFVFVSRLLEGDGRLAGNDRETDRNLP